MGQNWASLLKGSCFVKMFNTCDQLHSRDDKIILLGTIISRGSARRPKAQRLPSIPSFVKALNDQQVVAPQIVLSEEVLKAG